MSDLTIKFVQLSHREGLDKVFYNHSGDSGFDLHAATPDGKPVIIEPFGKALIPTGLCVEIPEGYEIQIRSRSGLALKKSVFALNSPGTIDASYRGEIGVILYNANPKSDFIVWRGDRVAQAVVCKVEKLKFEYVDTLSFTERGEKGFGSTGI